MDIYIGFEYNGIKVNMESDANIKGFILNEGEDLKFPSLPSFNNEFAFPKFGEVSYFLGTTKENRTIGFTVALYEVTIQQYRNFLSQLSSNNPSYSNILKFDYNEDFGYKVKLNSISEGKFLVSRTCDINEVPTDLYHIELNLEFVTYNDWAAQYLDVPIIDISTNTPTTFADLFTFTFTADVLTGDLEIQNNGTLPIYLKITFTENIPENASTFTIKVNGEEWITFPRISNNITVFTKFGLVWDNNSNSFLPTTSTTVNKGAIEIPSGTLTTITFTSSEAFAFSSIIVEAILREII